MAWLWTCKQWVQEHVLPQDRSQELRFQERQQEAAGATGAGKSAAAARPCHSGIPSVSGGPGEVAEGGGGDLECGNDSGGEEGGDLVLVDSRDWAVNE